jgi:hypothetical protein
MYLHPAQEQLPLTMQLIKITEKDV